MQFEGILDGIAGCGALGERRFQPILHIAYRLWEEAERPIGSPDEHWYRAEVMLRNTQ